MGKEDRAAAWIGAIATIIAAVIGIIGVLIAIGYIVLPGLQKQTSSVESSVTINSPTDASQVSQSITASGTALNIPQGEELWFVVQTDGTQDFYPQTDGTSKNATGVIVNNGQWNTQLRIGSNTDNGVGFTVIAVLADQDGVSNIQQYFANVSSTGKFSPLHDLNGMKQQASVQVKRLP